MLKVGTYLSVSCTGDKFAFSTEKNGQKFKKKESIYIISITNTKTNYFNGYVIVNIPVFLTNASQSILRNYPRVFFISFLIKCHGLIGLNILNS